MKDDDYPLRIEPDRTVTVGKLIELARELGPDGKGLAREGSGEYNSEYTRGIVNLITDAAMLPVDSFNEVTEAVTEHVSEAGLSESDLDFTMRATFLEKPDRYGPELPVIEIGGILVFVYIKDGRLHVSVSLDTTDKALMHGPDHLVPMQIDVQDDTVFEA